jgi:hypothetical protein
LLRASLDGQRDFEAYRLMDDEQADTTLIAVLDGMLEEPRLMWEG